MKKTKLLSLVLALLFVFSSLPFTAFAAAKVNEINGERVVLVSSFGKMAYEGKSYETYKSFSDAFKALGTQGGKVAFTGKASIGTFTDIDGRGPVIVEGTGSNPSSNVLDLKDTSALKLTGDLTLSFVTVNMAADSYIFTGNHTLTTLNKFDSFFNTKYVSGGENAITYPNPVSIAPGDLASGSSNVNIGSGTFGNIVTGAVKGKTVNGSSIYKIADAKINTLASGSNGGDATGSSTVTVTDSEIGSLYAGGISGNVTGNTSVALKNTSVKTLTVGPESGSVTGDVAVSIHGGTVNEIKKGAGTVSGKTIICADAGVQIPAGVAQYIIRVTDGICTYDSTDGMFLVTNKYGIPAYSISVNGTSQASQNGKYSLPAGEVALNVLDALAVQVNKNAVYVAGYSDGAFAPQKNMTRAEAFTLITRIITDENALKGRITADYDDVAADAWYSPYAGFLQALGVLEKLEVNGKILPDQNITRAEFAELLYRIDNLENASSSTKVKNFSDVSDKNTYVTAITYAAANGIVNGYEDGAFKPDNNITRAEVVTMVNRYLGRNPNGQAGSISFGDIADHWAKDQILAASGAENVTWTAKQIMQEYTLTGKNAEEYVKGLYDNSASLSADAIRRGVDVISEQMKKDVLNTPNTEDIYGDQITTKFYISEKNGNDENDGTSPETAWKTMAALSKIRFPKKGTAILFERGGIYRGNAGILNGVIYGSYGEGPKPLIMQSRKNYADPALWEETEWPNVWKLTEQLTNVGIIGFDHDLFDYSADSYKESYGLIMNKNTLGFKGPEQLNGDLQFYSVLPDFNVNRAGDLYLYSKSGNPGSRFKSIEIGEKVHIFDGAPINVIFDNLAMKFTGAHAISLGTCRNIRVTNCVFSWLGGSVLSVNHTGAATNYGNAVQVYGGCDGYYVENNWMYQIYDTAVTHQRSHTTGDCIQKNVEYLSNLMEYVFWGIEFYNAPPTAAELKGKEDTYTRITENVRSAYNVLRLGGYGWGSIVRYRGCQLYCGSTLSENRNCIAEYNIFDRGNGDLLTLPSNATEIQDKNIYIQTYGKALGNLRGSSVICTYEAEKQIRNRWGDKNAVVIVIDPEIEPVVLDIPEGLAPRG